MPIVVYTRMDDSEWMDLYRKAPRFSPNWLVTLTNDVKALRRLCRHESGVVLFDCGVTQYTKEHKRKVRQVMRIASQRQYGDPETGMQKLFINLRCNDLGACGVENSEQQTYGQWTPRRNGEK